ncbi:hypothetical protein NP284_31230 [Rhodopseudomonas pseudopalustris]|uniref:Uncharacterized protein n=2 Tax=Rhodopseudomonas pseudopalustris TaxID=1513892 RepID=A0A1H8T298_9BRAD|nr:hypothetical protein SAMN05444123_105190 [Rhodopseudomonas pseudopalustris]
MYSPTQDQAARANHTFCAIVENRMSMDKRTNLIGDAIVIAAGWIAFFILSGSPEAQVMALLFFGLGLVVRRSAGRASQSTSAQVETALASS